MSPAILLLALRLLLALVLYAFLLAIILFLWRDLREDRRSPQLVPEAHFLVLRGPEEGRVHPLSAVNDLGRGANNTLRLTDDTVSAQHARLIYHDGQWWLEDLGSRNGTMLNQKRVDVPLPVVDGDQVTLGAVLLRLQVGPPSPEQA